MLMLFFYDLDARSQWVGKGKKSALHMLSATKQAISSKLALTVDLFVMWPYSLSILLFLQKETLIALNRKRGIIPLCFFMFMSSALSVSPWSVQTMRCLKLSVSHFVINFVLLSVSTVYLYKSFFNCYLLKLYCCDTTFYSRKCFRDFTE